MVSTNVKDESGGEIQGDKRRSGSRYLLSIKEAVTARLHCGHN